MKSKVFNSFIDICHIKTEADQKKKLEFLYENYLGHRYDLLGSGPVPFRYGWNAGGFDGRVYKSAGGAIDSFRERRKLKRYANRLHWYKKGNCIRNVDEAYQPINWFCDLKSGFFFHPRFYDSMEKCLGVVGRRKSVEIKVPWELGRFYHLPQMAVLSIFDKTRRTGALREFRNELMDFVIMNPYKKTVQWSSAMEVSIRAVNLLVSFDIFCQLDSENILDDTFQREFYELIEKSRDFILENLEYGGRFSSNHYLSNIAGLTFIAAYSKASPMSDSLLAFCVQELIDQVHNQFHQEGSHFEGSTSYHRLSAELVVYPTALILGVLATDRANALSSYDARRIQRLTPLSRQKFSLKNDAFFPQSFIDRVYGMAAFTKGIMRENGEIPQVGDNDSGRLLKLSPVGEIIPYEAALDKYHNLKPLDGVSQYFDENVLDHRSLIELVNGLFPKQSIEVEGNGSLCLERSFIESMAGRRGLHANYIKKEDRIFPEGHVPVHEDLKFQHTQRFRYTGKEESLLKGRERLYYPQFGVLVEKSKAFYLCVVVDTTKYAKHLGHTHNDKLGMELFLDGTAVALDPGTYAYTSSPEKRDRFRGTSAHSTIYVHGVEQNNFKTTFDLYRGAVGELLEWGQDRIMLRASYKRVVHVREIRIQPQGIVVIDKCNHPFRAVFNRTLSDGYGKLRNGNVN